jgi:hypothetical protein
MKLLSVSSQPGSWDPGTGTIKSDFLPLTIYKIYAKK